MQDNELLIIVFIAIIILMGIVMFYTGIKRIKVSEKFSVASNDEDTLTPSEIQKIEEYMEKKYQYFKWKFLLDFQLYHFKKLRLDPEIKDSIPKVEIQSITKPIEDETFFKVQSLKSYLKQVIRKYNPNLDTEDNLDLYEYLTLLEKALAGKAYKEVLDLFKPYIESEEEKEAWKKLIESEPKN